ncbi:MAG: hypothetical protein IJ443_02310 [Firmicutes bacterium]|nr:hypothetical protein [Bacillota bacterium]
MKKCSKLLSVMLTACLVFTMNLGFASASSTGDTTAPVVNSMTILNPEIGDGSEDTLNVEFDWIEEGIGVLVVDAGVRNINTNKQYAIKGAYCDVCGKKELATPCFTGVHEIQFGLDDLPGGTYEFYEIYVDDDAGNHCEIFSFAEIMTGSNRFNVVQGIDSVTQAVQKVELLSDTARASGTIKLNVTLGARSKHNLADLTITFREKGTYNDITLITPSFDDPKAGTYCVELSLSGKKFKNAEYEIVSVKTDHDRAHNGYTIMKAETLGLTENDTFTVTGSSINPDYTAPDLVSIDFIKDTASTPGTVSAVVSLKEEGNGVDRIRLSLRETTTGESLNLTSHLGEIYEGAVTTGTYECAFPVFRGKTAGTYEVVGMSVYDNDGNFHECDSTCNSLPPGKNITILPSQEGDVSFFVSLSHVSLMDQVNSMEEGQTGLIDIGAGTKTAPAELFKAIAGKDVTLIFDFAEEYQWIINGLDVDPDKCKDIDLEVHYGLTDGEEAGFKLEEEVLMLMFRDNGQLPGKMTFRIQAAYLYAKRGYSTSNMKLYYLNNERITKEDNVTLAEDGAFEFEIDHNSDFAVSSTAPNLGKVGSLKASAQSMSSIKVTWTDNAAATGYYVYRSISGKSGTFKKIATVKTNSYTDKNLSSSRRYYYKVKPYNSKRSTINKTAKTSGYVSATPKLAAPKITSTSSSTSYVKVSWKATSGAAKYYVYRSTSKNGTYKKIATTSKPYYIDKSAKPMKTYYYKIRAVHPKYSRYNSNLSSYKLGRISQYKNGIITKV